jgi:hypothetical protein
MSVAGALLVGLLWGVSAAHAGSHTVTFRGGPLAPVLCPSAPEPPSLDIVEGAWVNVVNQTGAAATLEVDGVPSQTIAQGGGLSVMLPVGIHDLRLIPHCPTRGKLRPVVVEVAALGLPAPSSGPGSTAPASSGDPSTDRQGRLDVPGSHAGGDGPRVSPITDGSDGSAGGSPSVSPVPRSGPGHEPVQADFLVVPYTVPVTEDPRGQRLLTVIAIICVFGVTAAIIRAILAQRTKAR